MSVPVTIPIAEVNFSGFLHITATKVPIGSPVVWETWIPTPFSSTTTIAQVPDFDNYYFNYYESPTNVDLGVLHVRHLVNALTNEWEYKTRFYTCGGSNPGDPASGTSIITDAYLAGKNIVGVTIEAFRPLKPLEEWSFDDTTTPDVGVISILTGVIFNTGEVITVYIKNAVGVISSSGNGLYSGILTAPESSRTLLVSEKNKLIRLAGVAAVQEIFLPSLAGLSADDGFYFDNSGEGVTVQPKILTNGSDRIRFNGFFTPSINFPEFWVSKGEHLLIKKFNDAYWEVRTDYKGVDVGTRMSGVFKYQAGWHPEDGTLSDGNEYGRIWWFINTVLPSTHVVTDSTVTDPAYVHPAGKEGLFVKHPTLKKFRWPNTQGLTEKGLKDFNSYGTDTNRLYDYPGGKELQRMMNHRHLNIVNESATFDMGLTATKSVMFQKENSGNFKYTLEGKAVEPTIGRSGYPINDSGIAIGGTDMALNNTGVIYMVKI